jgi:hypothetical protein
VLIACVLITAGAVLAARDLLMKQKGSPDSAQYSVQARRDTTVR